MATDILRKSLAPQSEEWLSHYIPQLRRSRNAELNIRHLDLIQKLKDLGLDATLAEKISVETSEFQASLAANFERQGEAFVEVEVDRLSDQLVTQAEMNQFAFDRYGSASRILVARETDLLEQENLSDEARSAFTEAQKAWNVFLEKDSLTEGLLSAEGGSMLASIQGMAMESLAIERIARLDEFKRLLTL